jgi:UDP-2,3-diacylglucosamine hydrolase
MEHSILISDLHLCESRPNILQIFTSFLKDVATQAQSLYILGDFFEYWPGDDTIATGTHQDIITALRELSSQQVNVFFMHGNRDFLLGQTFADAANIELLPDPSIINLYGHRILLSHGDALCTDDISYQAFRKQVRSEKWQEDFLSQPLDQRIAYIEMLRVKSQQEKSNKSLRIMDVNMTEVEILLATYDFPPIFIHGHTHRPNKHIHTLEEHRCERWVLADWYEQGSYLRLDKDGCHEQTIK